jgi:hypothetical protein
MTLAFVLLACGGDPLEVLPSRLDFGEVDFQQEPGSEGLAPLDLTVAHVGRKPLDLRLLGFDAERFALGAQLVAADPPTLPTLEPGQRVVIRVGVVGYVPGEWDTLVEGRFTLDADALAAPVFVPWSYTPVRNFPADTGG